MSSTVKMLGQSLTKMQYEFECAKSSELRYIISHFPCNLSGGQSWNKTHELYMGINALQSTKPGKHMFGEIRLKQLMTIWL